MLEREKKNNLAIKFANSCISNQIMEPLQLINQYVVFLLRKMAQRPEIINLLEAI